MGIQIELETGSIRGPQVAELRPLVAFSIALRWGSGVCPVAGCLTEALFSHMSRSLKVLGLLERSIFFPLGLLHERRTMVSGMPNSVMSPSLWPG